VMGLINFHVIVIAQYTRGLFQKLETKGNTDAVVRCKYYWNLTRILKQQFTLDVVKARRSDHNGFASLRTAGKML
jgi:hypothetical protein